MATKALATVATNKHYLEAGAGAPAARLLASPPTGRREVFHERFHLLYNTECAAMHKGALALVSAGIRAHGVRCCPEVLPA